jgi:hypothetical protein
MTLLLALKLGNVDELHIRIGKDEHRRCLSCFQHGDPSKTLADPARERNAGEALILTKLPETDYKKASARIPLQ